MAENVVPIALRETGLPNVTGGECARVDLLDAENVRHWCERLDCSEAVLKRTVEKVGTFAPAVEHEIRRIQEF